MRHRISKLHERQYTACLSCSLLKDDSLTFEEKDEAFTLSMKEKHDLLMYKVKHGLCPMPVQKMFTHNEIDLKLRHGNKKEGIGLAGRVLCNQLRPSVIPSVCQSVKKVLIFSHRPY